MPIDIISFYAGFEAGKKDEKKRHEAERADVTPPTAVAREDVESAGNQSPEPPECPAS